MAIRQEVYRITFLNKGQVYEVFARQVCLLYTSDAADE